tara:strand:+ start:990 stop:2075 length:1086 start_codon:yes stop_codon:yes gene_type:complete
MSYFNSLSSWQTTSNQIQQHQQDIEQESNNYKAQTLQDKFNHVERSMADGSGALMGFGGGLHIARKVFKKVKGVQDKVNDLKTKAETLKNKFTENTSEDTTKNPIEEQSKLNGTEDDNRPLPKTEVEEPSANIDEPQVQGSGAGVETQTADEIKSPSRPPPAKPAEAESTGLNSTADTINSEDGSVRLGQSAESINAQNAGNLAEKGVDAGADGAKDGITALQQGGNQIAAQTASKTSAITDSVSNVASKATNAGDIVSNIATNAGKTILDSSAKTGAEIGSTAIMDSVGVALDFMGPGAEIIGAGLALGSLFHDLFGNSKKKKDEKEAIDAPTDISQNEGISTASIASASTKTNVVDTLV